MLYMLSFTGPWMEVRTGHWVWQLCACIYKQGAFISSESISQYQFYIFHVCHPNGVCFWLQATWKLSKDDFKVYPDIAQDPIGFMKILVDWMKKRANSSSNRDGLATDVMRKATDVWPGVGVYTSDELFWITGVYYTLSCLFVANHTYPRNSPFCHWRGSVWPTKPFTGSTCLFGIISMGARNPRYLVMYFNIIHNWSWLINMSMHSTGNLSSQPIGMAFLHLHCNNVRPLYGHFMFMQRTTRGCLRECTY